MKTKIILAVLLILFVLSFVFFLRLNQKNYQPPEQSSNNPSSKSQEAVTKGPNSDSESGKVPLSELEKHNNLQDCWIVYKRKVYDITSYLPRHPGTAGAITPYCGSSTEFEKEFTKKHGTSKVELLMKVGTFVGDFDVMGKI